MLDFKSTIKKKVPYFFWALHNFRMFYFEILGCISPELLIRKWYRRLHGFEINLDNPVNLDEKINWMKLHGDMSLWIRCADKYEVRSYVKEHGLGHTLNELYGVYDSPEDIDFDLLPDSFVMKTTNGGGGRNVYIVQSKDCLNRKDAIRKLNKWLREKSWRRYYEPHYKFIKPRIVVEKYLKPSDGEKVLVDYKINCADGKVIDFLVCSEREYGVHANYSSYDINWDLHPEHIAESFRTHKVFPKPMAFDLMVEYSSILSKGIPYVRVDWYQIDGKPVFGELTFTPSGGFDNSYSMSFLKQVGSQISIPR